jgi:hypothetical protein
MDLCNFCSYCIDDPYVSDDDYPCLLGPTQWVPPEDGNRIQSPKCFVSNKRKGGGIKSRITRVVY